MIRYDEQKMCCFCSAWKSYPFLESEKFGYCARYSMKTQAFEWCETCDKRAEELQTHSSEMKTIESQLITNQ